MLEYLRRWNTVSQREYILYKIEKYRNILLNLINKEMYLTDIEVVHVSQELDKQLNAYNRMVLLGDSHSEFGI